MSMEERMTICNMSIEGGARVGYVNPDETTFAYLQGRAFAPQGEAFDARSRGGSRSRRTPDARYDDEVDARRAANRADRHLGHQPRPVGRRRRAAALRRRRAEGRAGRRSRKRSRSWASRRASRSRARRSTSRSSARAPTAASRTCARPRGSSRGPRVAPGVRALVVPGSEAVRRAAEAEGLDTDLQRGGLRVARAPAARCASR